MPGEPHFSDISRILFPLARAVVIYLARTTERPAPFLSASARSISQFHCAQKWCGVRLIPEVSIFRLRGKNRAGDPYLCFVLHHMGFLMRPRLHKGPVGSYPAFSTLPRTIFERQRTVNFAVLLRPKMVRGGIFSVILSVIWGLRPKSPRFSRGMLPYGVRTFLWHNKGCASDHPSRCYYTTGFRMHQA
jgi:hypothetical protein